MITRFKNHITNLLRYFYWKYEEDLLFVAGILFIGWIMYHAYPIDPNMPV